MFRICSPLLLLFLATGGAGAQAPEPTSRPKPSPSGTRKVTFPTEDNLAITAGYTPARQSGQKAPIVVLLHMYRSDRSAYDPLVPYLHRVGFAVLALDLRGHGESAGPPQLGLSERVAARDRKLFADMYRDVEAAYAWLAEQPDTDLARFALVGASVGASIALDYASRDRSVDAVVCLTPGTSYLGLDSLEDARKYGRRPLLLVASEPERAACDELARIVPDAVVRTVPGPSSEPQALHGTRLFGKAAGLEQGVAEFLAKAVGPPGSTEVIASIRGRAYYPAEGNKGQHLTQRNVRWFSSPAEAEARGLHAARSSSGTGRARQKPVAPDEAFPTKP